MTTKPNKKPTNGFTLVETMVSLIIFGSMVASILPLFGVFKAATIQNDTRLGASVVAQQVMDEIRRANMDDLQKVKGTTIEKIPDITTSPGPPPVKVTGASTNAMTYKGKTYRVATSYCDPDTTNTCDSDTVKISVKVFRDGGTTTDPIFQLETVYTTLK